MQQQLKDVLQSLDALLDSYQPGEVAPHRMVREVLEERAAQRSVLEEVVNTATEALDSFPFNPELIRRRAFAKMLIVTPDGEYPLIESAEADLRLLLDIDPNNIFAATDLLEALFTFSGLEDSEVAQIADKLASKVEGLLIDLRALQIKALGYADEHERAEEVYRAWSGRFPDEGVLQSAIEDVRSMNTSGVDHS